MYLVTGVFGVVIHVRTMVNVLLVIQLDSLRTQPIQKEILSVSVLLDISLNSNKIGLMFLIVLHAVNVMTIVMNVTFRTAMNVHLTNML